MAGRMLTPPTIINTITVEISSAEEPIACVRAYKSSSSKSDHISATSDQNCWKKRKARTTLHRLSYPVQLQKNVDACLSCKKDHPYTMFLLPEKKAVIKLTPMGVGNMGKFSVFVMMVMCCWASMAEAEYMLYKDSKQSLDARINDLFKRMTLEEKIGQVTQIERSVASNEVMKKYFIASISSGGGSVSSKLATPEAWINMVNDFQKGSLSTRLGIPMIYGIDAVHGNNNVYKSTIFPHNVGLGITRDPILVKRIGAATAPEVGATGIQYAFAPCIAVCRDPRWGRCYESYSEDTEIVRLMTEIIPGLQGEFADGSKKGAPFVNGQQKVAACAKHYLKDGGTHLGTNEGSTILNSNKLFSIHMPAYNDAILKGVATIMTSYSSWNGVKMHANRNLVTNYLKKKLNFKGFVISDWERD